MKFSILLVTSFTLTIQAYSQWTKISLRNDAPITETITDVSFVGNDTGYVSTAAGILYKTIDGGGLWTFDTINPNGLIFQVQFLNSTVGFMAVHGGKFGGTIVKTIDGGQTWFDTGDGNNMNLPRGMHFFNSDTGLVGSAAGIFRTVNGGQTWSKVVPSDKVGDIGDIHFINDTLGFVYYRCFGVSTVSPLHTSISITKDAGATWIELYFCNTPFPYITSDFYYYLLSDSNFIGFDHFTNRLVEGNIPFTKFDYLFPGDSSAFASNPSFMPPGNDYPHNIRFFNSQLGIVAYRNAIVRTENGGKTWNVTDFPYSNEYDTINSEPSLRYVACVTADKWVVMGNGGRIYFTNNKGGTLSGFNGLQETQYLNLHPNPATTQLTLTIPPPPQPTTAIITDVNGRLLRKEQLLNATNTLNIAELPAGLYFVTVQNEEQRWVRRFVKE